MGYHAPDAEEVYQYIFRIGRYAPRKLTDGFGWSILFVNDSSPACKEFLVRYGAELCYRTADRVRFVFFSGLTGEETQRLADRANMEWGEDLRVGFLPRIIAAIGRPGRDRFALEHYPWDLLRPDVFYPLDSSELIQRHLSMECEIRSVMPGAEEALLLAQRIGIGRFVPCFLLFSDVGSPVACVYPFSGRSPDEVFDHIRIWVDKFYEINNQTLRRWTSAEKAVQHITAELRSSVYALSQWCNERLDTWKGLRRVALYQDQLERSAPNIGSLDEIEADRDITRGVRETIRLFRDQWRSLEQRATNAVSAVHGIATIKSMQTPQDICEELKRFRTTEGPRLPEPLRNAVTAAINAFTSPPPPLSPTESVFEWWRSDSGRPPSRNKYDNHRLKWELYSKRKYGNSAIGRAGEILRDEFLVVQEAISAQRVDGDPASAAAEVIGALTQHLGASPEDLSWLSAISSYREVLVDYFTRLKEDAPGWIIQYGSAASPPLSWGECIPSVKQLQENRRDRCLQLLPRLGAIIDRASRERDTALEAQQRRRLKEQSALKEVYSMVESWASAGKSLEGDKLSIWLAAVACLSGARKEIENNIFLHAKEGKSTPFPHRSVSRSEIARLLELLDGYDRAVASLILPFESDGEVLRISLDIPLSDVSRVEKAEEQVVSPVIRATDELLKAAADADEARGKWEGVRQEASRYSPAGALCHALRIALSTVRLQQLQPGLESEDFEEAVSVLASRQKIIQVLDKLFLQELLAVETLVCTDAVLPRHRRPDSKTGIVKFILIGIGLEGTISSAESDQSKVGALREKARLGRFDVFLAHNSEDQDNVLRLGERLRNRGIYPWIDAEQVPPGRWFQDILQSAIRTVKSAAIIIGAAGIGRWQALEVKAFVRRCIDGDMPVIPVLLPGIISIPEELVFLRELSQVRFENDMSEDAAIARLIWGITGEKP